MVILVNDFYVFICQTFLGNPFIEVLEKQEIFSIKIFKSNTSSTIQLKTKEILSECKKFVRLCKFGFIKFLKE